jgi:hypothetical protein
MFQIHPLPAAEFRPLYGLSDDELAARTVEVHISDGAFPCRVSLADAAEGTRVLLLNYEHQPGEIPRAPCDLCGGRCRGLPAGPDADYLHLHYARRGCFAARVTRAGG